MILSLSLTASGKNYFFFDGTQVSDPVTRYQIYKDLHMHTGQDQELIQNQVFESLTVEDFPRQEAVSGEPTKDFQQVCM